MAALLVVDEAGPVLVFTRATVPPNYFGKIVPVVSRLTVTKTVTAEAGKPVTTVVDTNLKGHAEVDPDLDSLFDIEGYFSVLDEEVGPLEEVEIKPGEPVPAEELRPDPNPKRVSPLIDRVVDYIRELEPTLNPGDTVVIGIGVKSHHSDENPGTKTDEPETIDTGDSHKVTHECVTGTAYRGRGCGAVEPHRIIHPAPLPPLRCIEPDEPVTHAVNVSVNIKYADPEPESEEEQIFSENVAALFDTRFELSKLEKESKEVDASMERIFTGFEDLKKADDNHTAARADIATRRSELKSQARQLEEEIRGKISRSDTWIRLRNGLAVAKVYQSLGKPVDIIIEPFDLKMNYMRPNNWPGYVEI